MIIIKEAKIKEKITSEYVENIWKEMLVFLKNIQRVKNSKQYIEFLQEWMKWIQGYFYDNMTKNFFGFDTIHQVSTKVSRIHQEFKKFEEDISLYLLPSKLDYQRWIKKSNDPNYYFDTYDNFVLDLAHIVKGDLEKKDNIIDLAFAIFESVKQSKYVGLKKKIDEYFEQLIDDMSWLKMDQLFIKDDIRIEGVLVHLEYSELDYKIGSQVINDYSFIKEAIKSVEKAFKLIKDSKFSSALKNAEITLSTVSSRARDSNVKNGKDFGTGGFFSIESGTTTILNGKIVSLNPWNVIESIIHEQGHKYYYRNMDEQQRKEWKDYFFYLKNPDTISIRSLTDFLNNELKQLPKSNDSRFNDPWNYTDFLEDKIKNTFPEIYDIIKKEEQVGAFIYGSFNRVASMPVFKTIKTIVDDKINFTYFNYFTQDFYKELSSLIKRSKSSDKIFPTEYASTNESEFFAETFTAYCTWKTSEGRRRYKLIEHVFEKFIEITGIRSAWHEKKDYINNDFN